MDVCVACLAAYRHLVTPPGFLPWGHYFEVGSIRNACLPTCLAPPGQHCRVWQDAPSIDALKPDDRDRAGCGSAGAAGLWAVTIDTALFWGFGTAVSTQGLEGSGYHFVIEVAILCEKWHHPVLVCIRQLGRYARPSLTTSHATKLGWQTLIVSTDGDLR